jgi:hypothetical protein
LHPLRTRKQTGKSKQQQPDMQWHKEKANGSTRKSQTRLGTLRALEFTHNAKCGNSRDTFFLVHGAEAVLPVEITHETPKVSDYEEVASMEALQDDVDTHDEARDIALARSTQHQQNLRNCHSHQVRP